MCSDAPHNRVLFVSIKDEHSHDGAVTSDQERARYKGKVTQM
jgi:hypothetical protein